MRTRILLLAVLGLATLSACSERATETAGKEAAPAAAPAPTLAPAAAASTKPLPTDSWVGEWTGPEGTALHIAGAAGDYELTIHDLDGPRSFKGRADGMTIRFERDGVSESIHAGTGDDTGMKWLAGKSDCLTVHAGEGYCRD